MIRSGKPCLYGTRLTVSDVLSIVADDEERDYGLTRAQIDACIAFGDAPALQNIESEERESLFLSPLLAIATLGSL